MSMQGTQPLAGQHALVTGGARGIGAAIARALLEQGARVTLLGRDRAALEQAQQSLSEYGDVAFVSADVAERAQVERAFAQATQHLGPPAILINNAGQAQSAPIAKTDDALWHRMLAVNLSGTFLCAQAALPAMLDAKYGRIVNVASTAGLVGYSYVAAYCAAKHGVIGLTRALALELATTGITVNAVCPGFTDTDLVRDTVANIVAKTGRSEAQARAELAAHNPQKRLIAPEEVAHAVSWLCLPASASITGQAVPVAGGEVM
jgi:NAD(P)-dependent dehydrogenase (short-subunit alcohol dehydrogenase family)